MKRGRPKGSKNKRKGPGRPKGSKNKKTRGREAKALIDGMIATGNIPKFGTGGLRLPGKRGPGRPKGSKAGRGKVTRAIVTIQAL